MKFEKNQIVRLKKVKWLNKRLQGQKFKITLVRPDEWCCYEGSILTGYYKGTTYPWVIPETAIAYKLKRGENE